MNSYSQPLLPSFARVCWLFCLGLITEAEFMQKLSAERAGYQAMLEKVR